MEHYENLAGGIGREVFFRAPRKEVGSFPAAGRIEVRLGAHPVRFNDISLSGMSVIDASMGRDWKADVGEHSFLEISASGHRIFSGPVEIARTETFPSSVKVGLRFLDWCPDLRELEITQIRTEFMDSLPKADAVASDLVPSAYKAICADVLHLITWQRDMLDSLETRLKGDETERRIALSVVPSIEEKVLGRWRELWQGAEDIVRQIPMDSPSFAAIKSYTEQILTPAFMKGAIWERSYNKPRGYPGDYAIMKMVYAWAREGETLADQMLHRIGLEVAECIATRMVLVQQAIAETMATLGHDRPARITSLGCGPAKEIENVLSAPKLPGSAQFTLIDQDLEALEDTHARLMPMAARHEGRARLNVLRESFVGIVRGSAEASDVVEQDLIYTVGLVDYLRRGMARGLVTRLYNQLAPGGLLIVGNMADSGLSNFWPMELITDWRVEYRSQKEMLDMATRCEGAEISVRKESTGRVWMLYIRKPG